MKRLMFSIPCALITISAYAIECPKGYQPFAERCITQKMADYISCVEASGGNRQAISEEMSLVGGSKDSTGIKVSGGNLAVRGSGSLVFDKNSENALVKKIEQKLFSGSMSECAKVLNQNNSIKKATRDKDAIYQAGIIVGKVFGARRLPTDATIFEFVELTHASKFNNDEIFQYQGFFLRLLSVESITGLMSSRPEDGTIYQKVTAKIIPPY